VRVTQELNDMGLEARLTIAGCRPPDGAFLPDFVKVLGYISKSTREGAKALERLLTTFHFVILPTKADCTPMVFPEANSFGIPCITTDVGGIPTVIRDGVNGQKLSPAADACEGATVRSRHAERRAVRLCKALAGPLGMLFLPRQLLRHAMPVGSERYA
jgi:glycosyltransferase involved in cell wall biosynthesis